MSNNLMVKSDIYKGPCAHKPKINLKVTGPHAQIPSLSKTYDFGETSANIVRVILSF